jgi:hypothetical protein
MVAAQHPLAVALLKAIGWLLRNILSQLPYSKPFKNISA